MSISANVGSKIVNPNSLFESLLCSFFSLVMVIMRLYSLTLGFRAHLICFMQSDSTQCERMMLIPNCNCIYTISISRISTCVAKTYPEKHNHIAILPSRNYLFCKTFCGTRMREFSFCFLSSWRIWRRRSLLYSGVFMYSDLWRAVQPWPSSMYPHQ